MGPCPSPALAVLSRLDSSRPSGGWRENWGGKLLALLLVWKRVDGALSTDDKNDGAAAAVAVVVG